MFPRFLFDKPEELPNTARGAVVDDMAKPADEEDGKKTLAPTHTAASERVGEVLPGYEKRTLMQRLRLWSYQPEDKTTYWQYFKRPFFLFAFPNVVLVSHVGIAYPTGSLTRHRLASSSPSAALLASSPSTQVSFTSPSAHAASH